MKNVLSLSLATAFLMTASQVPLLAATGDEKPYFCKHPPRRGLTQDQQLQCGKESKEALKKKEEELAPPKYPYTSGVLQQLDPTTGKQRNLQIISRDGDVIGFKYYKDESPEINLLTKNINSWNAVAGGTGTDASAAITTAVAGALFFWPMIVAAPFMVKQYSIMGFTVEYVDSYGIDKTLSFVTIESPRPIMSLLKFSTGLEAGIKREKSILRPLYEKGLTNSMNALEKSRKRVLVQNERKPWCSYLDLTKRSQESIQYETDLARVNAVRKNLGLEALEDQNSASTSEQWNAHLAKTPGLKAWAAAYPKQAESLKSCNSRN
jgi:hypothetical protein